MAMQEIGGSCMSFRLILLFTQMDYRTHWAYSVRVVLLLETGLGKISIGNVNAILMLCESYENAVFVYVMHPLYRLIVHL